MKPFKNIFNNEITYIAFGILTMASWLMLFLVGLFVDSSYYRVAITCNFAGWFDWVAALFSFFVSNVAILAFLSGLLGGICSKIISTKGFTLSPEQLKAENVNYILYENPFLSGFRGVFMFMGILSIQYLSSFTELGSLAETKSETKATELWDTQVYRSLLEQVKDTNSLNIIKKEWAIAEQKQLMLNNDAQINEVRLYNDSLKNNIIPILNPNETFDQRKQKWKEKMQSIRNKIKVPPAVDIPGISSASYFKFAVIVSLLAFICGYDPSRFNSFINSLPALGNKKEKDGNKTT